MWLRAGDLADGAHGDAITRLTTLTSSSDDPAYSATLARALGAADRLREAEQLRADAVAHYERLALRHPEAYADHAAGFIGSGRPTSAAARQCS
jgi:hypothetical protein